MSRTVGSRQKAVGRKRPRRRLRAAGILSALCLLPTAYCLPGCGDAKPADSGYDRSEKALHDPMHYSPYSTDERKSDMKSDTSGGRAATPTAAGKDAGGGAAGAGGAVTDGKEDGGASDWDGLKRDLKHVLDP